MDPEASGVAGGVALAREEFSWPGARNALPPEAVGLVRAMTRGAPLEPVATVETERRRVRLIDGAGRAAWPEVWRKNGHKAPPSMDLG
ncbi:MAG: hypothetical protein JWL57_9 [Actinobacteria bacterium]|nr:hypothetical protein [Actinomycetota bacterium]